MLKFNILSLGCAKNLVDSEVMTGLLREAGYRVAAGPEDADILVINTCGFIKAAKEESIDAILEAARLKKGRRQTLIVAGCMAQRYKDELTIEIPEIDGLIGPGEIPYIAEITGASRAGNRPVRIGVPNYLYDHRTPRVLSTPPYSAYLKVAEGCSNRCTYCVIPEIRGGYRSRPVGSIIAEARDLAGRGVREVNLVAQDTTRYGQDLYGQEKLAELLEKLAEINGLDWIRVLYAYPTRLPARLMEVVAGQSKICKYLDLPLQHADDVILRAMNRPGSGRENLELIARLRQNIPGLALRTSLIVGFPGETDERFQTLVDFVKTAEFDRLGVFAYSPEEGTPAADLPGQVPEEVKEERRDFLLKIQQEISLEKNKSKIGQIISVLIEGKDEIEQEVYYGRTEADAPEVDGSIAVKGSGLHPGRIVPVRVTHAYEYDLIGEVKT